MGDVLLDLLCQTGLELLLLALFGPHRPHIVHLPVST